MSGLNGGYYNSSGTAEGAKDYGPERGHQSHLFHVYGPKDPAFKKAWHDLDAEFELLESIIKARENAGLTREELARRIGTKRPALSRLERGGFQKASIETLRKIAEALDGKLVVKIEPKAASGSKQ